MQQERFLQIDDFTTNIKIKNTKCKYLLSWNKRLYFILLRVYLYGCNFLLVPELVNNLENQALCEI